MNRISAYDTFSLAPVTVEVAIQGITPLMMHRMTEGQKDQLTKGSRKVAKQEQDPRTIAEEHAYTETDGTYRYLVMPSSAITGLLKEAGSYHKQRGTRKSLKYIMPAGVRILDEYCPLYAEDGITRLTLADIEVDERTGVNKVTKGRVIVYRPKLYKWVLKMNLQISEDVIDAQTVQQCLIEGGMRIGIGSFRPSNGGPFGCFHVVDWAVFKAGKATLPGKAKGNGVSATAK